MSILDTLDQWDKEAFLALNRLHASWLDPIMDWISYSMVPVAVILLLTIFFGAKAFGKKSAVLVFLALANFGATDAISSRLFKPYFERLRPCHNPDFEGLFHTVGKCWGGQFGFVSSHAANTFGVALFLWLVFRKRWPLFGIMIPYAVIVSYTRIYLAKHYPLDLVGGAALGALSAMIFYFIWKLFLLKTVPVQDRL